VPAHQQQQPEQPSPHQPLQTVSEAGSPAGDTPADAEATHSLQSHLMTAATDTAHLAAAAGLPLEDGFMRGTADSTPDQLANGVMAEAQSTAEMTDSMPAAEACDANADADVTPADVTPDVTPADVTSADGHPPQMAVLASLDQVRSRAVALALSLCAALHVKALLCLCHAVALSIVHVSNKYKLLLGVQTAQQC